VMYEDGPTKVLGANSLMSAPAGKAFGPPVMTAALLVGSAPTSAAASMTSLCSACSIVTNCASAGGGANRAIVERFGGGGLGAAWDQALASRGTTSL